MILKGFRKNWQIPSNPAVDNKPAEHILTQRGINPDSFFRTTLADLASYLQIGDLDEAAELVSKHILAGHKILIVADYDCDGLTSAARLS
jgi:hypothetical protein